ncbi:hypothetical protein ACN38_g10166 [Penicillium nordicum]|uniref:Uncharacterized protein n=1 Tax=Penicillium nordicum TaxID=229535 RepID=A0A0M9WBY4_9EURO|nr:hypothetical protein ACN38_g10166 [Penicillium nordicum]
MVRRCVSFALNDTMSILCLFTFLFFFLSLFFYWGFRGLGSERAKHHGVLAFSSPPRTCGIVVIPPVLCTYIDRIMSVTRICFFFFFFFFFSCCSAFTTTSPEILL